MTVTTVSCSTKTFRSEVKKEIPTLGIGIAGFYGWTIGLPHLHKMKMMLTVGAKHKSFPMKWGNCTPAQQYAYLKDTYLPQVVSPYVDVALAVPELTQNGCVHMHLICYNSQYKNEYDLWAIRKGVLQNYLCCKFHKMRKNAITALNYITPLADIENWIEYLSKDLDKHPYPCLIIK